jgi:ribosome-associated translation inhibitor RaiA
MNVEVTTRGSVAPEMAELARERVSELESAVQHPIIGARVVLQEEQNPRIPRSSRAEGELRLGGGRIRGRVESETMVQAVNDLVERLRAQLRRHVDRLTTLRRTPAGVEEGEWRRAAWTPPRPPRSWRAPGEREVIRRKTFALEPTSAIEAAADLSALDHDFYLFHDADTGADSIIYRRDDGQLAVIAPQEAAEAGGDIVREASRYSGPLELADAVSKMDELNHRFLFFTDAATGRGAVLYLRYDGHYGLIEPAT